MHYKNGRIVSVGDWVVGISHNSDNKVVCGVVLDIKGNCNIKIHRWRTEHYTEEGNPRTDPVETTRGVNDFGDCAKFIRVDDGLKMVSAVEGHGKWDGPYNRMELFQH